MRLILAAATLFASFAMIAASAAFWPPGPLLARSHPPPASIGAGRIGLTAVEENEALATRHFARPVATLLDIRAPLHYGEFQWNEAGARPGPVWISVDLQRQLLSVFRGGDEIGTAVILYGSGATKTPLGSFRILAKLRFHRSATYAGARMPYTLKLTRDGVSIHGSNVRNGYATHGCIGVPIGFAAKLFDAASAGDDVLISGA